MGRLTKKWEAEISQRAKERTESARLKRVSKKASSKRGRPPKSQASEKNNKPASRDNWKLIYLKLQEERKSLQKDYQLRNHFRVSELDILGPSELEYVKGETSSYALRLRYSFLRMVVKHEPRIVVDLFRRCWQDFNEVAKFTVKIGDDEQSLAPSLTWSVLTDDWTWPDGSSSQPWGEMVASDSAQRLIANLYLWVTRWNLAGVWCIDHGLKTLFFQWKKEKEKKEKSNTDIKINAPIILPKLIQKDEKPIQPRLTPTPKVNDKNLADRPTKAILGKQSHTLPVIRPNQSNMHNKSLVAPLIESPMITEARRTEKEQVDSWLGATSELAELRDVLNKPSTINLTKGFFGFPRLLDIKPSPPHAPTGLLQYLPGEVTRKKYLEQVRRQATLELSKGALVLLDDGLREKCIQSLLESAETYCNDVEAFYRKYQSAEVPRDKKEIEKHLTWTIEYLVLGLKKSEIANYYSVAHPAVTKAIKLTIEALTLRDLPLEARSKKQGS